MHPIWAEGYIFHSTPLLSKINAMGYNVNLDREPTEAELNQLLSNAILKAKKNNKIASDNLMKKINESIAQHKADKNAKTKA